MSRVIIATILVATNGCFDVLYGSAYEIERSRVTRDTHTPIFPIASGAHDDMDCNDCHGEFDTFTRFTCVSCKDHEQAEMDPLHQGNPDYIFSDTSCYECHPTGEGMSREQHQALFPILSGPHSDIGCVECHPNGYDAFTCIDCHEHRCSEMDDKHREEDGYACQSDLCLECHPQGRAEDD